MKHYKKQQHLTSLHASRYIRERIGFINNSSESIWVSLHLFFLIVGTCPVLGQQYLFEQDYKTNNKLLPYDDTLDSLWSADVYINKLSKDGNWVAVTEDFPIKENTLILLHTKNEKRIELQGTYFFEFAENSRWFASLQVNSNMKLVNLEQQTIETLPDISNMSFSYNGNYLAYMQSRENNHSTVIIRNLEKGYEFKLEGVTNAKWNPKNNNLIAITKSDDTSRVVLIEAELNKQSLIIESKNENYADIKWGEKGTSAMVKAEMNGENQIYVFNPNGEIKKLENSLIKEMFPNWHLSNRETFISDDGEKVLFYRQKNLEENERIDHTAEIWDTNDPWIYPRMKSYNEREKNQLITAWYPKSGHVIEIETSEFPTSAFHVNHKYALVYNKLKYEPLYKYFPNADLYVKNMETGVTDLVCKNQYTEGRFVTISPEGKYISYFTNGHWWVYDIENKKTANVTKGIKYSFQNIENELAGDPYPYGNPGWLKDDSFILLEDQFDIWRISPDGKVKEKVTNGRDKNLKYKIRRDYLRNNFYTLTVGINFSSPPLNLKNGIVLDIFNDDTFKTGYAIWEENKRINTILYEEGNLDKILVADDNRYAVFRKQKFNKPIGVYGLSISNGKQNLLYQTNEKLLNYDLGKAEIIEYELDSETNLKGALVYPADYNPQKKYPMIVHVYEKEINKVLYFNPPFDYNPAGFNMLKYITNDYFVFFPNISYTIGQPGISALKCVTAGVNKVIEKDIIDKNKIGLIGHSYGGYETSFMITQTDMFATAVAGASVTDLFSWYHDIAWDFRLTQLWRSENYQWRMGESFYNNKSIYYQNSPMHHIENVNTPILLWTGNKDVNINWEQSVRMFIALKRLGKESKLLLFDEEAHDIRRIKSNQLKLSQSIFNWMENYLKVE